MDLKQRNARATEQKKMRGLLPLRSDENENHIVVTIGLTKIDNHELTECNASHSHQLQKLHLFFSIDLFDRELHQSPYSQKDAMKKLNLVMSSKPA